MRLERAGHGKFTELVADHIFRDVHRDVLLAVPHGAIGWCRPPPPLVRPPIGWSTGFIAMPRTVGRMPRQRLAPALPIERKLCSSLPTVPIVARQSTCTLRISPECMRN